MFFSFERFPILVLIKVLKGFPSFEGFPILVLIKVLLQILVPWNKYLCKIVLPVSGFFLVFLYYFDCVDPILPRHIIILDGQTMYINIIINKLNGNSTELDSHNFIIPYATALTWVGHLFKFILITFILTF